MAKKQYALPEPKNPAGSPTEPMPATPAEAAQGSPETSGSAEKPKWQKRFGSFIDNLAGVRLVEDRENKRMIIQFTEKPSEAARSLVKSDPYRYRFDSEEQVWYKPISPHTPTSSRSEAQELALKVADLIRSEKGIVPRVDGPAL